MLLWMLGWVLYGRKRPLGFRDLIVPDAVGEILEVTLQVVSPQVDGILEAQV